MNAKLTSQHKAYLSIGVGVFLLEVLVIWAAERLGAGPVLSVGLAFWIGLSVSFLFQKLNTFKDWRFGKRVLSLQLLAYVSLVLFNFGFTLLVTALLGKLLPAIFCRGFALGVTTIWNFYLYKTRIFAET